MIYWEEQSSRGYRSSVASRPTAATRPDRKVVTSTTAALQNLPDSQFTQLGQSDPSTSEQTTGLLRQTAFEGGYCDGSNQVMKYCDVISTKLSFMLMN
jgi:hypothetical protein